MNNPLLTPLVFTLSVSACHTYETAVTVADPTSVALAARTTSGELRPVLPPSGEEQSKEFWSSGLPPPADTVVWARRNADGSITLECDSLMCRGSIPIVSSEGQVVTTPTRLDKLVAGDEIDVPTRLRIGAGYLTPTAVIEWSDVASASETKKPDRMWGLLLVPGAILTTIGVVVANNGGGAGVVYLGGGLALDGVGAYQLLWPKRTRSIPSERLR